MKSKVTTLSLFQFLQRIPDEKSARKYFESLRWAKGRFCPHCKSEKTVAVKNEKPQPYRCKTCRKHFSIRTRTILTASNVPLQKWLLAAYLMNTAKKGVSSCQMSRELGVTQKTAWLLCHKIREVWTTPMGLFTDTVEVDEMYLGGKEKNKHANKKQNAGRGIVGKQAVVGVRERTGKIKAKPIADTTRETLHGYLSENIASDTDVYTDDHRSYLGMKKFRHQSVNHSAKEYVRGDVHTNGIESFWALVKRGYTGTFHHYSRKHTHRYLNEFSARLNNRFIDTEDILALTAKNIIGKRLSYKELVK